MEELACAGFEAQRQSEDGTGRLTQDVGSAAMGSQAQVGLLLGRRRGKKGSVGEDIGAPNLAMGLVGVEKGGRCVQWVFRR